MDIILLGIPAHSQKMNLSKALKNDTKLAVFTRNHEKHLANAAHQSAEQSERLIPLRARSRWSSAAEAIERSKTIPVYFAVVDSGPLVQYVADLCRVIVDPQRGQPETDYLLGLSELPNSSTIGEGLWETSRKPARTLYAVSHVRKLQQPFPMTELIKLTDDKPISSKYGYSYTMVYSLGDLLSLSTLTREKNDADLAAEIDASRLLSEEERSKRLDSAVKTPERIQIISMGFRRNADVIVSVLHRANGICEECFKQAPFSRRSDGSPYLEVHHRVPLSQHGEDTVENAAALCPNCHRKAHHG
jgi:hypothetical protein